MLFDYFILLFILGLSANQQLINSASQPAQPSPASHPVEPRINNEIHSIHNANKIT